MSIQANADIVGFAHACHCSLALVVEAVHSFGSAELLFGNRDLELLGFLP